MNNIKEKYNKVKYVLFEIILWLILIISIMSLFKLLESDSNSMLSNQTNLYTLNISDEYNNLSGKVKFTTINNSEHNYNIEYVTNEICKQLYNLNILDYGEIDNIKITEILKNRFEITFNSSINNIEYITYVELRGYYDSYYLVSIANPTPA